MANLNFIEMAKVAVDKKLCKEYRDANKSDNNFIVYLNDGDEFQIQLFNPTNRIIGAKIKFKDEHRSSQDSLIVLKPGERVWLERFLDCHDKFVFNTYEVSNSSQVMEAIKDNGDLTIEFFYESENRSRGITVSQPTILFSQPLCEQTYYCGDALLGINSNISAPTCTSSIDCLGITSSATAATSTYCSTTASSATVKGISDGPRKLSKNTKSVETGRVEHGGYSDQSFKNVYYDFEYWPFYTKYVKLLPTSRKQYSDSDLKKVYCTNCGKKLSPKFRFCPACGTKVNG